MKSITSLNDSVMLDLYIEKLEEKVDLSRISPIDFLIDSSNIFNLLSDDGCVDCGVNCSVFCGVKCDSNCTGYCSDFCAVNDEVSNEESETSNPNPWEIVWNQAANSNSASTK